MSTPPLGWINPNLRNQQQNDAHEAAVKLMPKFAMAPATLAKGERILLTDAFSKPEVVADIGYVFPWFHQITGSCIGASLGTEVVCLSAIQRLIAENPTKEMVPWWPYNYGMTRYDEGDRGRGEGAINSVAVERMKKGVLDALEPGLPQFVHGDGLTISSSMEMEWSDGGSQTVRKWESIAAKFPLGTAVVVNNTDELKTGIINGYPGYNGCSKYVGGGSVKGTGNSAVVMGRYDGSGGHSTGFVGVWDHLDYGLLFCYQNNWRGSTYPADPISGERRCQVWLPELEVAKIWTQLDGRGEIFMLSHLNYLPAQPAVRQVLTWTP